MSGDVVTAVTRWRDPGAGPVGRIRGRRMCRSALEERFGAAALLAFGGDRLANAPDLLLHRRDVVLELVDRERRQVFWLARLLLRRKILVLEHVASGSFAKPHWVASLARSG